MDLFPAILLPDVVSLIDFPSIRAIPAAVPEPQFGIGPPHYSISWDAPQPVATTEPGDPDEPEYPSPTASDQISLGQPSATISWDGGSTPTNEPEPEDPDEPLPSQSNIISLNPPSYSVSWDGPRPPKTTRRPWPRPSHKTSTKKASTNGYVSATVSWGKAQDEAQHTPSDIISLNPPTYWISWDGPKPPKTTKRPVPPKPTTKASTEDYVRDDVVQDKRQDVSYSITWDGPQPPRTTRKPWPWWPPAWTSTNGYVSASVSWGKRQDEADPEPTDFSADPENPISFPGAPAPTPPNSIGVQPPQVSISWGKRQDDEPEPTDSPNPEDPEEPENPISFPGAPAPTPPNSIGFEPPQVSFSWGKREAAPTAPSYGLAKPTVTSRAAWISWGKRQDDGPTEVFPPAPTPSDQITFIPPTATISWGKRDAEAQSPTWGLGFPTFSWGFPPQYPSSAYISWGKRDDDDKGRPTTFLTHKTRPSHTVTEKPTPTSSSCPTVTSTVVPPCVPPTCPHSLVSCKVGEAQILEVEEAVVREIEKTILTITTVAVPSGKPTPTKNECTTSTVVVNMGCPTWTCVPGGECALGA